MVEEIQAPFAAGAPWAVARRDYKSVRLLQRLHARHRLAPDDVLRDFSYRHLFGSILIRSFGGRVTMLALPLNAAVLPQATPTQPQTGGRRRKGCCRSYCSRCSQASDSGLLQATLRACQSPALAAVRTSPIAGGP